MANKKLKPFEDTLREAVKSWNKFAIRDCVFCGNPMFSSNRSTITSDDKSIENIICVECQAKNVSTDTGDKCTLAYGRCGHAFHLHCILRWLQKSHVCPLDGKEWKFKDNR